MPSSTIKDVARAAGVSHTTVSRALRDHPAIAPQTVARVKSIAAELGYVPSAVARGLKTSRSEALGVIVSSIDDPYFSEVLQGVEDVAQSEGYSLFVAASHRDFAKENAIVQAMGERRVDGVIICSTSFSREHGRRLEAYGMPIVVLNNQAAEDHRYSIYHDDHYGTRAVTRHLIDLGHRRIGYLANAQAGPRTVADRLGGFQAEMAAAGLPVPDEFVIYGPDGGPQGGLLGAQQMLALARRPSALVCYNDYMAVGAMRALQAAGLHLPGDCSVAGFDNILVSTYVTPPLTTFDQPKYSLGAEAARMILRLLKCPPLDSGGRAPEIRILRGTLLVRASTAPPPV